MCEIPTASSNNNNKKKKKKEEADTGLAVGTPAGFDPMKECFKRSRWFGKRHKTDAFTKLGEPTVRAACTPQTVLGRHFWGLSASFTIIWPSFPRFHCTPNKACLLCTTPAGTHRVQSPGFPKEDRLLQTSSYHLVHVID